MIRQISRFAADDAGANALEYTLIIGLVSLAIVVGATAFGTSLNTWFTAVSKTVGGLKN